MGSMKTFLNDINYLVVLLAWTQNTWQLLVQVQVTWGFQNTWQFLVHVLYCTSHVNKLTSYYPVYGKDKS